MQNPHDRSRIVIIDALRGFALAGVALTHMAEQYVAGPHPDSFMSGINGPIDQIALGLIQFFLVGKFFALFSVLFGLSFAIQMDSAARRNIDFSARFLWRAMLLLLIGYAHHLFYRGDILLVYALLAPFLIPFHKVSDRWLFVVAIVIFSGIPRFIVFAVLGTEGLFGLPLDLDTSREADYFRTISGGSLLAVFEANGVYGLLTKWNYQIAGSSRLFHTFAYFLLGLWLGRSGLLRNSQDSLQTIKTMIKRFALAWILLAILTTAAFATMPQPVDFGSWHFVIAFNFVDLANLCMAAVIGLTFVVLFHKTNWNPRLAFFAPYGRMALTNYLLQSLIGTFLLFGWGLGLLGEVRSGLLILLAMGMIAIQAQLSKIWLRHFQYGPLEWLWRSGTFLHLQPFRKHD
ncbi:MAG: DUF418 domain-containing protein [Xanthomonadales bacterium]|nr:DUF418 domain-containing protein [Gammaproteobacteria bacterium]NND58191.1 DUF418 domain-containing protein [Xanthomonadales bacterium]NNK50048.1 DUF418 domain-containing protein [Xanthomonadales bacterium]